LDESVQVQLQKLSPKHKQVASLMVQGVSREIIGEVCEFAPEYVTWLARQPVMVAYLRELAGYADAQLIAMTGKSVAAIGEVLEDGSHENKLRAVRLQFEATDRIGRYRDTADHNPAEDRLERLAGRLVGLLETQRGRVLEGTSTNLTERNLDEAEIIEQGHRPDAADTSASGTPALQNGGAGSVQRELWESSDVGQSPSEALQR